MIINPKIGQKVWFQEMWSGCLYSGNIVEFGETERSAFVQEKHVYAKIKLDKGGTSDRLLSDLYGSQKELKEAIRKESQDRINDIKSNIHDINDFVKFLYDNCVATGACEYTDWDARKAAKEIAKEMLGLELE